MPELSPQYRDRGRVPSWHHGDPETFGAEPVFASAPLLNSIDKGRHECGDEQCMACLRIGQDLPLTSWNLGSRKESCLTSQALERELFGKIQPCEFAYSLSNPRLHTKLLRDQKTIH